MTPLKNEQSEIFRLQSAIKKIASLTKSSSAGGDQIDEVHRIATAALSVGSNSETNFSQATHFLRHPEKRGWPDMGVNVKHEVGK